MNIDTAICSPTLSRVMSRYLQRLESISVDGGVWHARSPPEVQSVTHARITGSRDDSVADSYGNGNQSATRISAQCRLMISL